MSSTSPSTIRWIADREIFRVDALTSTATVEPRAVLRHGLKLGAARFLIFHSHVQGDAT